jgi:hypothetical protein
MEFNAGKISSIFVPFLSLESVPTLLQYLSMFQLFLFLSLSSFNSHERMVSQSLESPFFYLNENDLNLRSNG